MRKAQFAVPARLHGHVRDEMTRHAFEAGDAVFDETRVPHGTWTKLTTLLLQLREWESDRRFSGFMTRFGDDHDRLLRRYEQLSPKFRKWFRTPRQPGVSDESGDGDLVREYKAEILQQCSDVLEEAYTFLSRALLKCEFTYAARTSRLRGLGFDLEVQPTRLTLNRIMVLFGSISLIFIFGLTFVQEWVVSLFHPQPEVMPSVGAALSRSFMIAIIYVLASCCAIVPKERWPGARREAGAERPALFYFVAATAAAALGLVVSYVFGLIIAGLDFGRAAQLFFFRYPWALMSFATAFTTAYLADDPPASNDQRKRQRLQEGMIQAAVSVTTAVPVLIWLHQIAASSTPPAGYTLPDPLSARVRAALIGFVIGYKVPTWYREAPREAEPRAVSVAGALAPAR